MNSEQSRTNQWLEDRMYGIWENHFSDIPRKNYVLIKFGRSSSRQLGSIKWATKRTRIKSHLNSKSIKKDVLAQDDGRITVITITRKFQDPSIPDHVIDATIAHELVHYAHGFSSPLKQLHEHPHQGGLIRKELSGRGLGAIHQKSRSWIKEHWTGYT